MGFRFVKNPELILRSLEFIESQNRRDPNRFYPAERHHVFTRLPQDTRIKYVPWYLLEDGADPNGDNIVYTIDRSIIESLKIL